MLKPLARCGKKIVLSWDCVRTGRYALRVLDARAKRSPDLEVVSAPAQKISPRRHALRVDVFTMECHVTWLLFLSSRLSFQRATRSSNECSGFGSGIALKQSVRACVCVCVCVCVGVGVWVCV